MPSTTTSFAVAIVGGGAAGISVAALLRKRAPQLRVAIIDAATTHDYQPAWTLVGAGEFDVAATRRPMQDVMPDGVTWIHEAVEGFEPGAGRLTLADGAIVEYEQLVVAAGLQTNWGAIAGLEATLGKNGVCSNYSYASAPYTWQCIQEVQEGKAIFTQPPMPIKCPGAPQKIMYMAADHFKRHGRKLELEFYTATPGIFGVPFYAKALTEVVKHYGIAPHFGHRLVEVDGPAQEAMFETVASGEEPVRIVQKFDLLHVTPPQSAPAFIKASPLADAAGFVAVDKHKLQHTHYANVFALGDCAGTANSKTAAAVRAQAPVLVANLLAQRTGEHLAAAYDGYASCPLTTSVGKIMLAEFGYDGVPMPSFAADPRQPRKRYWHLKKRFLPWLYWSRMLKGEMGPDRHAVRAYPEALPPIAP